ncbi:WD40 repeat domain-containing protein [bacterium]|nr:WD40 repeat domain-containing protein [bacterium]
MKFQAMHNTDLISQVSPPENYSKASYSRCFSVTIFISNAILRWTFCIIVSFAIVSGSAAAPRKTNAVTAVAISPNCDIIAIANRPESTISLYSIPSKKFVTLLNGPDQTSFQGSITCLAFSTSGTHLLSGGEDKTARIWNITSGEQEQILRGHEGNLCTVAFSSDGALALTSANDGTVRLWEAHSGIQTRVFTTTTRRITGFTDVLTGKKLGTEFADFPHPIYAAFSPDNSMIASSYEQTRRGVAVYGVRLWNTSSGKHLRDLPELENLHNGLEDIETLSFSPNGRMILIGSDSSVSIWDLIANRLYRTLKGVMFGVKGPVFSPDGDYVLAGRAEPGLDAVEKRPGAFYVHGTLALWNLETGKRTVVFGQHGAGISSMSFSSNGKFVLSGSYDDFARLWEAKTGVLVTEFGPHRKR